MAFWLQLLASGISSVIGVAGPDTRESFTDRRGEPQNLRGTRNAENELRTLDSAHRQSVTVSTTECDAVMARCQSILLRVEKTFGDPWWDDIVSQQRSGQTTNSGHDNASERQIPKMA